MSHRKQKYFTFSDFLFIFLFKGILKLPKTKFKMALKLPFLFNCDIHNMMYTFWLRLSFGFGCDFTSETI